MKLLYHFPLCPFSRSIRIVLAEKNIPFELVQENYWERNYSLASINPAVEVPVFIDDENVICDSIAIFEYLEEQNDFNRLLGTNPIENAEIRRLSNWFSQKFYNQVTKYILNEKVIRYYKNSGQPNSDSLRVAKTNLEHHLAYLNFLLQKNQWIAGNKLSFADIAAASQLSSLDYLGDVYWDNHLLVKDWYSVIKSRPSFRAILKDKINGFNPSSHYIDLDF